MTRSGRRTNGAVPPDSTDARLARLTMARDRLVARLDDPATPAYSVAPLSNQLRLTDKEIERLTSSADDDDGLPTTAERAGWLDFVRYEHWLWRGEPVASRNELNAWARRERDIWRSWRDSGLELPTYPDVDYSQSSGEERQAERDDWVVECRRRLAEAMANVERFGDRDG